LAQNTTFDSKLRLIVIYGLALSGSTARMIGEFFREAAVLLVVFVPLELWKPTSGVIGSVPMWQVLIGCFFLLFAGIFLESVQKLAKEPWKEYAERAWVDSVGACTRAI
jgi:hypothetical protein